ncbi:MAG: hypothetical protein KBT21_08545 [Treponema sp.]|nr:hypothetical protein [Candidatus Treponema merdequi]
MSQLLFDFPELKNFSTPKTNIEVEKVIKDFGITNLNAEKTKNTRTGREIDFSKSNYDWVKSQVDYFNSDFTDKRAWETFTTIIYKWYYNFGFKKYKDAERENLEKIQEWAEEAYMRFIKVYKKRIELVKYFQGKTNEVSDDRWTKRILNTGAYDTSEKQFAYLFQAKIGSLKMYVVSLKLEKENKREISLEYLMEKSPKLLTDNRYCFV